MTIDEVVKELNDAKDTFLNARMDLTWLTSPKDAWQNLRKKCQQLSQWIEHVVPKEMKPELCKTLYAAEALLVKYEEYGKS